ncbi:MAG TPA: phosphomethylpyrimidine synthase ThiC [Candidatus Krumholzibacteriaceae bacterium]|nr:phosphomethylpyrimidine synthase ThiC [Candidatus Krumholzibacteriaceae bacterium]
MTEYQRAKRGEITRALRDVAEKEGLEPEKLRSLVAEGKVILTGTAREHCGVIGIGRGLRTKVNANIGTSPDHDDLNIELEKLKVVIEAGSDAVMDLSTGGDIDAARKKILEKSTVPVGTVPVYQVAVEAAERGEGITDCEVDHFFEVIEKQARDGVDFMTVHCGLVARLSREVARTRLAGVVSRGGSLLMQWMARNGKENPYFEHFDRLLDLLEEYDVSLSLGDGLRPGALADSTDRPQIGELLVIGDLVERARARGVSVFVEGPGHIPLNEIETNMIIQKKACGDAPFYVLGPIVTDVAPGYDHITAAVGGAVAAWHGADFLCYVTPAEHLRLPSIKDARDGVIATRIAAHAGDIAKGIPGAKEWDDSVSIPRAKLEWKKSLRRSLDPDKAEPLYDKSSGGDDDLCTMCGEFCAIRGTMRTREDYDKKEDDS